MRNLFVFLGAGVRDPHHTGAVLPSSRALARAMVSPLRDARGPLRVLEVGAGTGVVTGAILDRLDRADSLVIYEMNPALRMVLEQALTRRSSNGDGPRIELVGESIETIDPGERFDFIISGLPLNNFEPDRVDRILRLLGELCGNGGTLTYFEYAGMRALRRRLGGREARLRVRRLDGVLNRFLGERRVERQFVLWNVPPALVRHLRNLPAGAAY
jgi:phospholipid N-methyltransferase